MNTIGLLGILCPIGAVMGYFTAVVSWKRVETARGVDMRDFKFGLGDKVEDIITSFTGIVVCQCRWITNCDTYGVQSESLKDGVPQERTYFDEPQLVLLQANSIKIEKEKLKDPGGPERPVKCTNRF